MTNKDEPDIVLSDRITLTVKINRAFEDALHTTLRTPTPTLERVTAFITVIAETIIFAESHKDGEDLVIFVLSCFVEQVIAKTHLRDEHDPIVLDRALQLLETYAKGLAITTKPLDTDRFFIGKLLDEKVRKFREGIVSPAMGR